MLALRPSLVQAALGPAVNLSSAEAEAEAEVDSGDASLIIISTSIGAPNTGTGGDSKSAEEEEGGRLLGMRRLASMQSFPAPSSSPDNAPGRLKVLLRERVEAPNGASGAGGILTGTGTATPPALPFGALVLLPADDADADAGAGAAGGVGRRFDQGSAVGGARGPSLEGSQ